MIRDTPQPPGSLALIFDTTADETVGAHRSDMLEPPGRRDLLAVSILGGGFVGIAALLLVGIPAAVTPGFWTVALFVGLYALVSRIEFEVFTGASVPTMLVFVPMLLLLPLGLVPFAVAAGLMLGSMFDWTRGTRAKGRILLNLVGSWHATGPVVVLWIAGAHSPAWSRWPVYVAALLAQFACEIGAIMAHEWIARNTYPRDLLPHLVRAQLVDLSLAPVGLAFAIVAAGDPMAILVTVPLVVLLSVFARERRARIDNALELSSAYRGTAFLLGDVVEADDTYTGLHSRDVVELSVAVASEMRLSAREQRDTEFVALLHDVGKIRIPTEIINKPGKLDEAEMELMKTHTIEGQKLLEQVGGVLGEIGRVVRSCHERWDGGGYPDGLAGEEIPRVARIVACCDAFSAMTTDRSYRRALPLEAALAELERNAGTQFDPDVVAALVPIAHRLPHLQAD